MVKLSKKRGEQVAVTEAPWDLFPGESDHKIFQFIRYWRDNRESPDFSIFSLDTDVKILSVVFSALFPDIKFIIKSQRSNHTYFYPGKFIDYMQQNFVAAYTKDLSSTQAQRT